MKAPIITAALALLSLHPLVADSGSIGAKDTNEIKLVCFTDPCYPAAKLGERGFTVRLNSSTWTNPEVFIQHANNKDAVLKNPFGGSSAFKLDPVATTSSSGGLVLDGTFTLPFKKPNRVADRDGVEAGDDLYGDGESVYYRYVVRNTPSVGPSQTLIGSLHFFQLPRRLVFSVFGDSYMSGEGAFRQGEGLEASEAWISELNGISAHRSPDSGAELAMYHFQTDNPTTCFDYLNVSSSGAIAVDIYSTESQASREGKGNVRPQWKMVDQWLNDRNYPSVDGLLLCVGGNDFGFESLVSEYLGAPDLKKLAICAVVLGPVLTSYEIAFLVGKGVLTLAAERITYSFREGWKHEVSGDDEWSFVQYRNQLEDRYGDLAAGLCDGHDYSVKNVFIVEYPNLMHDYTGKYYDLAYLLKIDTDEVAEVRDKIAISATEPDPSNNRSAGLNHRILEMAEEHFEDERGIDVTHVPTGAYMQASWALPKTNRRFNTVSDALFHNVAPHRILGEKSSAIHPNQAGHRDVTGEAILYSVTATITDTYREDCADAEGFDRTRIFDYDSNGTLFLTLPASSIQQPGNVEAAFEQLEVSQPTTGEIRVDYKIENIGEITIAPMEIRAELFEILEGPTPPGQAIHAPTRKITEIPVGTLAAIPPGTFIQGFKAGADLSGSVNFEALPLELLHGSSFNAALYGPRDRLLASIFPSRSIVRLKLVFPAQNTTLAVIEPFENDNPTAAVIDLAPEIAPAEEASVLNQLATHLGLGSLTREQIDYDMLRDPAFLDFFGIADPVSLLENAPSVSREALLAVLEWGAAADGQSIIPPDKRIPAQFRAAITGSASLDDGEFERGDFSTLTDELPADGRSRMIRLSHELGGIELNSSFPVSSTPTVPHLISPTEGSELLRRASILRVAGAAGFTSYRVIAGRQRFGYDLFNSSDRELAAGEEEDITIARMPRDGGKVFVTLQATHEDGTQINEVYVFESAPSNARLVDTVGRVLDSGSADVAWVMPPMGAQAFRLGIGSIPGARDVFGSPAGDSTVSGSGLFASNTASISLDGLPTDGRPLYVRLETQRAGSWDHEDYVVRAASTGSAGLISPAPGSMLKAQQSFTIRPGDEDVTGYELDLGTTVGSDDIHDSPIIPAIGSPEIAVTVPPDAITPIVYATLTSYTPSGSKVERWQFTRPNRSEILTPANGIMIARASTLPVTWSIADPNASHLLLLGTLPGLGDLDASPYPAGTSAGNVTVPPDQIDTTVFITLIEQRPAPAGGDSESSIALLVGHPDLADYTPDDIPDGWQTDRFGLGNPLALPGIDADGDGLTNEQEYLADSDPTDPLSGWDVEKNITGGAPTFRFRLHDRAEAFIECSDDLNLWQPEATAPLDLDDGTTEFTLAAPSSDDARQFFRISIRHSTD